MTDNFDPYYIWLGIPPEEQPPNYYRLLAINAFEANADVIESAADRQMAHLRTFQSGKHGAMSQRLLNVVAAAKINLLDPQKKAAYDQSLRAKLAASQAPAPGSPQVAQPLVAERLTAQSSNRPQNVAQSATVATAETDQWEDLLGNPSASTSQIGKSGIGKAGASSAPSGKSAIGKMAATAAQPAPAAGGSTTPSARKLPAWVFAAPVVGVLFVLGICYYLNNQPDPPPEKDAALIFDWRPNERHSILVTVDDEPVSSTGSGIWEFPCTPGPHHIVAKRVGYKPQDFSATTTSGGKLLVGAAWQPKATLAINWPIADRAGGELTVDGKSQSMGDKQPIEIAVEPGPHVIDLHRPHASPLQQKLTVAADQRQIVDVPPSTGKLLVVWPVDDRTDAQFAVDSVIKHDIEGDPVSLELPPGPHRISIVRRGFRPFNTSLTLAAGENKTITVVLTPNPRVVTTPVPKDPNPGKFPGPKVGPDVKPAPDPDKPIPEPKPPAAIAVKLPVPSAADQERVAKQVDQLYKIKATGNPDDDVAHVKELFDLATKSKDAPVDRYVLMTKAIELAEDAGEVSLAMDGIDGLDRDYIVDANDIRQKALDRLSKGATREESIVAVVTAAEKMADDAIADDKYDVATTLLADASRAAAKKAAGVDFRKEVEKRLNLRRADIKAAQGMFAVVDKAKKTLETDANDPDANLAVGRWICFHKAQWDEGLPYLTKGKDEKLKAVAQLESPPPDQPDKQVAIADAWADVTVAQPAGFRDAITAHAIDWYQRALPNLSSGLVKLRVEKKLKELADARGGGKPTTPGGRPITNSIGMRLAYIPAGEFLMGSPVSEPDRGVNETQHKVRITKPFYMGVFPVTQAEYLRVTGVNPSYFSAGRNAMVAASRIDTARFPVEQVGPDDAVEFCRLLSDAPKEKGAGRRYRLPTEAEWEYACRAGTTTAFNFGPIINLQLANYCGTNLRYDFAIGAKESTTPVGAYRANGFGLCDMHGNVFQICKDWYGNAAVGGNPNQVVEDPQGPTTGFSRVTRGGSFYSTAALCRSAARSYIYPTGSSETTGFRVVCETGGAGGAAKDSHSTGK